MAVNSLRTYQKQKIIIISWQNLQKLASFRAAATRNFLGDIWYNLNNFTYFFQKTRWVGNCPPPPPQVPMGECYNTAFDLYTEPLYCLRWHFREDDFFMLLVIFETSNLKTSYMKSISLLSYCFWWEHHREHSSHYVFNQKDRIVALR